MFDCYSMVAGCAVLEIPAWPRQLFSQELVLYLCSLVDFSVMIYAGHLPQYEAWRNMPSFPAIVYNRISSQHVHHLRGGAGIAKARYQIDCWGRSLDDSEDLAEKIRLSLQGYAGPMGNAVVTAVVLDSMFSNYEGPVDDSDIGLYRVSSDYLICYREAVRDVV